MSFMAVTNTDHDKMAERTVRRQSVSVGEGESLGSASEAASVRARLDSES